MIVCVIVFFSKLPVKTGVDALVPCPSQIATDATKAGVVHSPPYSRRVWELGSQKGLVCTLAQMDW